MAGLVPFFLTGGNAKIKVNGVTLAFCTDVQYRIEVKHADPRVLGMFEGHSIEPLSYRVSGSFTVIRYAAGIQEFLKGQGFATPDKVSEYGNGIGYWSRKNGRDLDADIGGGESFLETKPRGQYSFNPKKLENASATLLEISQKVPGDVIPVAKLRGVRITAGDFRLNKKGVATQTFTFQATYADEDSFRADFSGRGQQFE